MIINDWILGSYSQTNPHVWMTRFPCSRDGSLSFFLFAVNWGDWGDPVIPRECTIWWEKNLRTLKNMGFVVTSHFQTNPFEISQCNGSCSSIPVTGELWQCVDRKRWIVTGMDCNCDGKRLILIMASRGETHQTQMFLSSLAWCVHFLHAPGTSCLRKTQQWQSSRSIPSGSVTVGDSTWFRKGMMPCSCTWMFRMCIPVGLWLIATVFHPFTSGITQSFIIFPDGTAGPRPFTNQNPHPWSSIVHIQNPNRIYVEICIIQHQVSYSSVVFVEYEHSAIF